MLKTIGDDQLILKHYSKVADDIIELDTEDTLGFRAGREFQDKLDSLDQQINQAMKAGSTDSVPAAIDEFVHTHKLVGEQKQRVLLGKIGIHFQMNQHKESLNVAKRVAAIDPETDSGKNAAALIPRIEQFLKENAAE